jgi:DNA-binding NtrC family response regulator
LVACRYNKSKAAELLGMTRPRLYRRMQMLKIEDREAAL